MSRRFSLNDPSWGDFEVYAISEYEDGRWEADWEPFRVMPELQGIGDLFSRIPYAAYQDALRKYPLPLIKALGLPPEVCLAKSGVSGDLGATTITGPSILPGKEGLSEEEEELKFQVDSLAMVAYELWRENVYIIITPVTAA